MSTTIYTIGDHVYLELDYTKPYEIRKITEIRSSSTGDIEIKVQSYERRYPKTRELILHSNSDTWVSAALIRGKCVVVHLNQFDSIDEITSHQDWFYFKFTLCGDEYKEYSGEIHIGSQNQAVLPHFPTYDGKKPEDCETSLWIANSLPSAEIDKFFNVTRGIGVFARALDCVSSVHHPSLHTAMSSACRDLSLQHAHNVLHLSNYNISRAVSDLAPDGNPVLCLDELERWSPSEVSLFEQGMDKETKNFGNIKECYLPWKTYSSLIDFYYLWKTTNRYAPKRAAKVMQKHSRITKIKVADLDPVNSISSVELNCTGCGVFGTTYKMEETSGPFCTCCWLRWRKYGSVGSCEPRERPVRSFPPFFMVVTPVGRLARSVSVMSSLFSYSTMRLKPYCRIDLLAARKLCDEFVESGGTVNVGPRRTFVSGKRLSDVVTILSAGRALKCSGYTSGLFEVAALSSST